MLSELQKKALRGAYKYSNMLNIYSFPPIRMKRNFNMQKTVVLLFLVFAGTAYTLSTTGAGTGLAETSPKTASALAGTERARNDASMDESGADIVLLLDCSGKMKQFDPNDFRKPAAKLFISLLDENDTVSIIGFGDTVREIAPQTRNSRASRAKLLSGIDNITSKEFNTNLTQAVRKAFETLKPLSRKNRAIILLSDGILDLGSPAENEKSYKELKQLLPEIGQAGIKIHAIAFTELTDMSLLNEVAAETNGTVALAKSDKDLHVIFASTFEKIKTPEAIPLRGDSFLVDKNIREIILMISKKPGTRTALTDPFGQNHVHEKYGTTMTWYEADAFDMITIATPEVGTWKVRLSSTEGNKIFIITDLKLMSSFQRESVAIGEKITVDAWLEKQGMLLNDREILDQVAFSAQAQAPGSKNVTLDRADDGPAGEGREKNGMNYWKLDVSALGEYQVTLKAEGKTFQREKIIRYRAMETVTAEQKQKRHEEGMERTGIFTSDVEWKPILIKFGYINLLFACLVTAVLLFYRIIMKRRMKKALGQEIQEEAASRKESKS
jgi:hypothetical protein